MEEADIRAEVESRSVKVSLDTDWFTPAGNLRSAPVFVAEISNKYLNKHRTIKGKSTDEVENRIREIVSSWNEQEIKKRVAASKKDAKDRSQAEAAELDSEAKANLSAMYTILEATLSVDDKIDWEAEKDTRPYHRFSFRSVPEQPKAQEPLLPEEPSWAWLFPWQRRQWEDAWQREIETTTQNNEAATAKWLADVEQYEREHAAAKQKHAHDKAKFLAEQARFNEALAEFRMRFEAGDVDAIIEYCSRVLERSRYPDCISFGSSIGFERESGYVTLDLALPTIGSLPMIEGYKFIAQGNQSKPIPLGKKQATVLYDSVLDQIALRTVHEIIEACYIPHVRGVLLNGWVTSVNPATGQDNRERVRTIMCDRETFEALDLSRIDPAACIKFLAENVGHMGVG